MKTVTAALLLLAGLVIAGPAWPQAADPDVWKEHAAPDEDVARRGRTVLPFTREQIELLGKLLQQTRQATARGRGTPPVGQLRRVRVSPEDIPTIRVRQGYTTVVSFTDLTGAPWPIEEVMVDRRFLPDDSERDGGNLLYLVPSEPFLDGNLTVKLAGLADPVVAVISGGGGATDFRVDLRLGAPGPNVDAAALAKPEAFRAGDDILFGLLTGSPPEGAERMRVEGGALGDRAWRKDGDLFLVTRAHVLSPGPRAAERGSGGRWAYRLPDTPYVLVSSAGRAQRIKLQGEEN